MLNFTLCHAEVVLASRSRNEFGMTLAGQAGKLIQYSDISEINNIEIPLYFEYFSFRNCFYLISSISEIVVTISFRSYFKLEGHFVFKIIRYFPVSSVFGNGKSKVPGLFTENFAVT